MHYLIEDTELTWQSISNYLWGVRTYMKLQHQADPAYGVVNWDALEASCKVLAHVPGEPRKEVPFEVVQAILEALDPATFEDAQFGLFLLLLLFTFCRSESVCPKTFTGEGSFDVEQHWQVKDIKFEILERRKALRVRFKRIKQDGRLQRPASSGVDVGETGDWSLVGDTGDDSVFSVARWYRALMAHWPASRPMHEPFFLARDRRRAYTYSAAMSDLDRLVRKAGFTERYGLHGLRVSGYNWSKRSATGEDLTVAHGMWRSSGHKRYDRWSSSEILNIPANMVGARLVAPAERAAGRPPRGFTARQQLAADAEDELPPDPAPAARAPAPSPRRTRGNRGARAAAQRALRGAPA